HTHTRIILEHLAVVAVAIDRIPREVRVQRRAVPADLALAAGEHAELAHLGHGVHEVLEEQVLAEGEDDDEGLRPEVFVEALVRGEQALPVEEVDVVLVVEGVGRADVDDGGAADVDDGAGEVEVFGEDRVQGGVLGGEETVLEGGAVGDADGVGAGEGDEVFGGKVELGEDVDEGGYVGGRRREETKDSLLRRVAQAVAPAESNLVVRAAGLHEEEIGMS
ncbi:unnamed protein product, partial [Musa acuminata subsp. malaccensis]